MNHKITSSRISLQFSEAHSLQLSHSLINPSSSLPSSFSHEITKVARRRRRKSKQLQKEKRKNSLLVITGEPLHRYSVDTS
ncbi:unnamed protein product [Lathyrus oleraceus]